MLIFGVVLAQALSPSARTGQQPVLAQALGIPSFNKYMLNTAMANASLLSYFYGHAPDEPMDLMHRYVLFEEGCELHEKCYCSHASTSMVKARNTDPKHTVFCFGSKNRSNTKWMHECSEEALKRDCPCLEPRQGASSCFMGQQSPRNLVSVIALARRRNITHVIEQGRYYGHSAFIYHVHGMHVTSVELLPMQHTSAALRRRAPDLVQLDGDGSQITIRLIEGLRAQVQEGTARVAVIFDGEKREGAYTNSFVKVKDAVVFAVFDDTTAAFRNFLAQRGETLWFSNEAAYQKAFLERDRAAVRALKDLPINPKQPANTRKVKLDCPVGGCKTFGQRLFPLAEQEWTIVQGGRWKA